MISIPGLRLSFKSKNRSFLANDLDIYNAEVWAREALLRVTGNLVLGNVAYRDYSDQVSTFGSVVNVARPGILNARRKGAVCEEIKTQDLDADSFQIALDQYLYSSFKICDGEENRGLVDLIETHLNPAADSITTKIDLILAGQQVHFWDNYAGHLGGVSSATISDYLLETAEVMDQNAVPTENRQMIITSKTKTAMMKEKLFVSAEQAGQNRTLRTGELGPVYGFNFWTTNSEPYIRTGQASATAAINNAGGYGVGATALVVDSAVGTFTVGQFVVIAGDDTPLRIAAVPDATHITLAAPGLRRDVADNAVVRAITAGAVNKAGGYAGTTINPRRVGYAKMILTDGWTTAPKVGQPVAFGTSTVVYTIIEVSSVDEDGNALAGGSYNILLDRPLEANIADNDLVNLGPAGSYNLAFNKNALAAAFRPLPKPRTGTLSSVITYKGIPIRVTISYEPKAQYHLVVLDLLMGVAAFDTTQAAVMFG